MAVDRATQRAAADRRRPVSAPAPRPRLDTGVSAVASLQRRLGNQATQSVLARSATTSARDSEVLARVGVSSPAGVQRARASRLPLKVSQPTDRAELEAEETARKVMRMREQPAASGAKPSTAAVAATAPAHTTQRAPASGASAPAAAPSVRTPRLVGIPGGQSLSPAVRAPMERRFGAGFGHVRVHADGAAAQQSAALSANAFTVGQHIFFGQNRFQPQTASGQELLAHELTHTIQQGAAVQRDVVQRSAAPEVTQHAAPHIQRGLLDFADPRKYFADQARRIPGFTMLTVVIGVNPINNERVERNAGNILRAAIDLIPGGSFITDALNNHGVFASVSAWAQTQFDTIKDIGASIAQEVEGFLKGFAIADLASPGALWDRAKAIVERPIARVIAFAKALKDGIVTLIKDAILKPVAALARTTNGYPLLCTVMGKDPITGEVVAQDAESLLGAFMKFIGEDELWKTMQQAKAVPRAFAWFKDALAALKGFIAEIPALFVTAFRSLEVMDIVLIPRAFVKLAHVFGGFAGRFITWGGTALWTLLEIIFDVVSPGALAYIKKTGAALKSILRNPLPFVGNLVKAAKLGFTNFGGNFLAHLKAGLINWLTGSLPGVYIPKAFSLPEIAKFAFSVLGLTWANIRQKLVKATSETVVKTLETGFDIVVTLVRDGPAAAWDKIKEQLANLKDMVIGGITDFVVDMVVKKAIPKLIAMFIPGAGFISAIFSIYETIMVFVDKIKQIVAVVKGFVDSIVAIAAGQIGAAASRVENALAGVLSLAISFLAGFAGLGKVADKVMAVINKIRAPIDKALDWLVGWIVGLAKKLGKMVAQAGLPADPKERMRLGMDAATAAVDRFAGKKVGQAVLNPLLGAIKVRYGFKVLEAVKVGSEWWVEGSMSPAQKRKTKAKVGDGAVEQKPTVKHTKGSLKGHTVGMAMTADWLTDKHPAGSPPASGAQATLMELLVTNPSEGSTNKFIRGHLLNEHLGGPGTDENLFPITGNANSQHLHSTEKQVKSWIKKADRFVFYEVKVTGISSSLDGGSKSAENYVESTFVCRAILKDDTGKVEESFATSIPSVYGGKKQKATRVDGPPAAGRSK